MNGLYKERQTDIYIYIYNKGEEVIYFKWVSTHSIVKIIFPTTTSKTKKINLYDGTWEKKRADSAYKSY